MNRYAFVSTIILISFIALVVYGQDFTKCLNIPFHGTAHFEADDLSSAHTSGNKLIFKYETVPLRNTIRLINRNYIELYMPLIASYESNDMNNISKYAILEEQLIREADNNFIASETLATQPTSLFH